MNFKNWSYQKENAEKFNLYTESHLKELGRKPMDKLKAKEHKVYTGGRWKEFKFYEIENTDEIKHKNKPIIRELEINIENLCKSLYIINKSAKKSRDTKNINYYKNLHGIVARSKGRESELYWLKNKTVEKMIDEGKLMLKGYHIQGDTYLEYYTHRDYGFHIISNKKNIIELINLGNIDDKISSEVTRRIDIKFNEAVMLLGKYIS